MACTQSRSPKTRESACLKEAAKFSRLSYCSNLRELAPTLHRNAASPQWFVYPMCSLSATMYLTDETLVVKTSPPPALRGNGETPQLMRERYNDKVTQDKATVVVVACVGGRDGF